MYHDINPPPDNLVYPVRAKIDLRRELVASLDTFSELWTRAFNVFLERGGGQEEAARAQASYVRLTVGGWGWGTTRLRLHCCAESV